MGGDAHPNKGACWLQQVMIRHCKIGSTQVSLEKGSSRKSWRSVGAANGQCRSECGIPFMRLQQTSRHTGSRDRARRIQLQPTPENYALQTTSKDRPTNADDRPCHSRGSTYRKSPSTSSLRSSCRTPTAHTLLVMSHFHLILSQCDQLRTVIPRILLKAQVRIPLTLLEHKAIQ